MTNKFYVELIFATKRNFEEAITELSKNVPEETFSVAVSSDYDLCSSKSFYVVKDGTWSDDVDQQQHSLRLVDHDTD